ncbi:hypothetical protein [Pseudonocardia nigra]|uniref:hypothetical protein n=1 Tax=Pseudonocardia nigra TaxID=1921578 RepID=UPI001C5D95BB|nr:hypothetical protein [Pseudonocardia nigra]
MTRTARPALITAVLAALVVLGGCTSTVGGTPVADPDPAPTEGPGSDPVAWADRVCSAVLSFAVPTTAPPDFGTAPDLVSVQRTFSTYLGKVLTGVQEGRAQLEAVGRSPVPGGDEAVGRAESAMQFLEEDFAGAKATVDGVDPADPDAFIAALDQVESALATIAPPDPLAELSALPRLGPAAERAEQCRRLSTLSASPPR